MTRILPLKLHTRSEPYQLVTRHGAPARRWRGCSSTVLRKAVPQI
jgi:hypothetical protein